MCRRVLRHSIQVRQEDGHRARRSSRASCVAQRLLDLRQHHSGVARSAGRLISPASTPPPRTFRGTGVAPGHVHQGEPLPSSPTRRSAHLSTPTKPPIRPWRIWRLGFRRRAERFPRVAAPSARADNVAPRRGPMPTRTRIPRSFVLALALPALLFGAGPSASVAGLLPFDQATVGGLSQWPEGTKRRAGKSALLR